MVPVGSESVVHLRLAFFKLTIALDEQARTTFSVNYYICFGKFYDNDMEIN